LQRTYGDVIGEPGVLRKIAFDIYAIDRDNGIAYDNVMDPFLVVFNTDKEPSYLDKEASVNIEHTVNIGGTEFYKDEVVDIIEGINAPYVLDEDLYKQASEEGFDGEQVLQIIQSLPKEAQEIIADRIRKYIN